MRRVLRLLRAHNAGGNLDPDPMHTPPGAAAVVASGRLELQAELLRLGVVRNFHTVQCWHREERRGA